MGNKLRETRVVKRITQFQLRVSMGIHQSKISMIENGLIEARDDEIKRLSKALGVQPEELFQRRQNSKKMKEEKL